MKMCPWMVLGRRSRPDRPQDAKGSSKDLAFGSLLAENGAPRATCWIPLGTKIGSKIAFVEGTLVILASQNRLWVRVLKKHEKKTDFVV